MCLIVQTKNNNAKNLNSSNPNLELVTTTQKQASFLHGKQTCTNPPNFKSS